MTLCYDVITVSLHYNVMSLCHANIITFHYDVITLYLHKYIKLRFHYFRLT